ncbi:MAG TPA: hypothetical protein VFE47_10585 [Tepidisphaeraceae bacterium]|jgi:hypothetical protein|nr:hypothetical protein [Tepidisphaeraceae bacterium]
MFRLIRMAAYALLGYALYEFFVGLTDSGSQGGAPSKSYSSGRALTGSSGQGMSAETTSGDGGRASHTVGRGVVH